MKKLKLDKKASQKIVALALTTTVALSGCSSTSETKPNLLEGTILENARVITFEDGHIDIAVENSDEYTRGWSHEHNHYRSIITDEHFTSTGCEFSINYQYDITSDESIVLYLTPEELAKATIETLTNEDVKNIILRIFSEHEETKQSPTR